MIEGNFSVADRSFPDKGKMQDMGAMLPFPDDTAPQTLSDETLARDIRQGNIRAAEAIVRRHHLMLYRIARSAVGDDTLAREVVAEAIARTLRQVAAAGNAHDLSEHLIRSVLDGSRRHLSHGRDAGSEPPSGDVHPGGGISDEADRAIDALPLSIRAVFVLRTIQGLDVGETGRALNLSPEAVRDRHRQARALLCKMQGVPESRVVKAYLCGGRHLDHAVEMVSKRLNDGASVALFTAYDR